MIKIYTDAASNLFKKFLKEKELDISVLPMSLQIGETTYLCYEDDIDVDKFSKELYKKIENGEKAKTSLTSPGLINKVFLEEINNKNKVIFITLASGISGNYQSANLIANEINSLAGEKCIQVIDSKTASLGEGMIAIYAHNLAKSKISFDEVINKTLLYVDRVRSEFTLDNVKYLVSSGRVSSLVAKIAGVLSIKPMLYGSSEARIEVTSKVRGRNASIRTLASQVVENISNKNSKVYIAHCDCLDDAKKLQDLLNNEGILDIEIYYYDLVTGVHAGPKTLAVFYEGENRSLEKKSFIKSVIRK